MALQVRNRKLIFSFCDVNSYAFSGTCNSLFFPNSDVCKNKGKPIWAKQGIRKDGTGAKATVQDRQLQREICFEVLHLILLIYTHLKKQLRYIDTEIQHLKWMKWTIKLQFSFYGALFTGWLLFGWWKFSRLWKEKEKQRNPEEKEGMPAAPGD